MFSPGFHDHPVGLGLDGTAADHEPGAGGLAVFENGVRRSGSAPAFTKSGAAMDDSPLQPVKPPVTDNHRVFSRPGPQPPEPAEGMTAGLREERAA
jgi:hypothetical protein